MNSDSEDVPAVVNGMITSVGLPRLLGAIWGFDLKNRGRMELLKTKLRYVIEECDGTSRMISGSYLNISRTSSEKTVGTKHYALFRIQGELEPNDLNTVINCGIEDHWKSLGNDELGAFLGIDIEDSNSGQRFSIHPSSAPQSRSK